jgi:PAS domain S-box-containing protein
MAEIVELFRKMSAQDLETLKEIEEKDDFVGVITNSSLDAIIAFDCDFRITIFNSAAEKRSGVSKKMAVGRYFFDVFPDSWKNPFIRERLEQILNGVESTDRVERVRVKETEQLFRSTLTPLRQNGRIVGGLVIFRNVTHLGSPDV